MKLRNIASLFMTKILPFILLFSFFSSTFAQEIVETGFLRNWAGTPLTGLVSMHFSIYNDPIGGSLIWDSGPISVSVKEGLYTVFLGRTPQQPPLNETVFSSPTNYYMQYQVGSEIFSERSLIAHQARAILADKSTTSDYAITANIALHVDWNNIINKPPSGVDTANYALTANVALSLKQGIKSLNASATLTTQDAMVLVSASVMVDITLPDATQMLGQTITVMKTASNLNWVNVKAFSGQMIEEFTLTPLMAAGDSVTLFSDGSTVWRVIHRR